MAIPEPTFSPEDLREHARKAAQLLKALSNESRLMILCQLADGEMSVGEINSRIDLSQSALSQHLAVLRQQSLVSTRRVAQTIYYRVADASALRILEALHGIYCVDEGCD